MSRSIVAGMTDYSHQSFDDMLDDLNNWISSIDEVEQLFNQEIQRMKEIGYWNIVPFDIKSLFTYALKFLQTSESELQDICMEVNQEVQKHHVVRIDSLYRTAKELNIQFGKTWHSCNYNIADYTEPNFLALEKLYQQGRNMAADMLDLGNLANRLRDFVGRKAIQSQPRLYIDDIGSFACVKLISCEMVDDILKNGYVDLLEDDIQTGIEQIIHEPLHKKDWGGEYNDLYTTNILFRGRRISTAFLLKGKGLKKGILELCDCGKNGDQILRLLESPAQLFVVQFVGNISESVIKDLEGKVNELRSRGKTAWYCIINGQDTARLLRAYNKI